MSHILFTILPGVKGSLPGHVTTFTRSHQWTRRGESWPSTSCFPPGLFMALLMCPRGRARGGLSERALSRRALASAGSARTAAVRMGGLGGAEDELCPTGGPGSAVLRCWGLASGAEEGPFLHCDRASLPRAPEAGTSRGPGALRLYFPTPRLAVGGRAAPVCGGPARPTCSSPCAGLGCSAGAPSDRPRRVTGLRGAFFSGSPGCTGGLARNVAALGPLLSSLYTRRVAISIR